MTSGLHNIVSEMRLLYAETSQDGGGGWRAVGERIGISGAYARMIAEGERRLTPELAARWLGEEDVIITRRVPVCPSCHGIHIAGDCHGVPISAVVILAPGERVTDAPDVSRETSAPRPRKARKNISLDPAIWEASNARRIRAGMTWDEWEGR